MVDIYSKQKRSDIMRGVRSSNTEPEIRIRKLLHSLGYRFRLYRSDLPGKPDIVLSKYKSVIFIHGCFWHHHNGCKKSVLPKSNRKFWKDKIFDNVKRDNRLKSELENLGWKVLVLWECEVNQHILIKSRIKEFLKETNAKKNEK